MQATWHSNWQFIHNLVVSPLITYPLISSCEGTLWNHKVIFLWLLQNHICPTLATKDWNSPVCWAGAGSCLGMGGDVSCSVFFSVLKFRVEPGTASPRALSPSSTQLVAGEVECMPAMKHGVKTAHYAVSSVVPHTQVWSWGLRIQSGFLLVPYDSL